MIGRLGNIVPAELSEKDGRLSWDKKGTII